MHAELSSLTQCLGDVDEIVFKVCWNESVCIQVEHLKCRISGGHQRSSCLIYMDCITLRVQSLKHILVKIDKIKRFYIRVYIVTGPNCPYIGYVPSSGVDFIFEFLSLTLKITT